MAVDLLLGLQWGDEGKGKIVDVLTKKYNIIARFCERGIENKTNATQREGTTIYRYCARYFSVSL